MRGWLRVMPQIYGSKSKHLYIFYLRTSYLVAQLLWVCGAFHGLAINSINRDGVFTVRWYTVNRLISHNGHFAPKHPYTFRKNWFHTTLDYGFTVFSRMCGNCVKIHIWAECLYTKTHEKSNQILHARDLCGRFMLLAKKKGDCEFYDAEGLYKFIGNKLWKRFQWLQYCEFINIYVGYEGLFKLGRQIYKGR